MSSPAHANSAVQSPTNGGYTRTQIIALHLAWPALLLSSGAILWMGFASASVTLYFNLSYAWIVAWLLLLERILPYREGWQLADGQIGPDLAHTVVSKGAVQVLIVSILGLGLIDGRGGTLSHAPMWLQVGLGLIVTEFGLYWAHRLAHEWPLMWRFHAVHHSVERLWLVNTGRFHFVDSLISVLGSLPFLLLSGITMDAIVWISAITAYIGILTHCNTDMRCAWLNYVFNSPNLHRWHHCTDTAIGNNNYGENLMLWDMIFGTYYHRSDADVATIGIAEHMPSAFTGQLLVPFMWTRYQSAASE